MSFLAWDQAARFCSIAHRKKRSNKKERITFEALVEANNLPHIPTGLHGHRVKHLSVSLGVCIPTIRQFLRQSTYTWTPAWDSQFTRKVQGNSKHKQRLKIRGCEICGETRVVDGAHLVPRADAGDQAPSNIVGLCPTHHALFDSGKLNQQESEDLEYVLFMKFRTLYRTQG